jgi:hypothetical protein
MTKSAEGALVFAKIPQGSVLPAPWYKTNMVSEKKGRPQYCVWARRAPAELPAVVSGLKMVDDLGRVLAKIAELEKEAAALKDALREVGPGSYEGRLFRATVGEDGTQVKRDGQAMRDKLWLEGFHAFVKAHEEEVPRQGSVRCVAKTGKEVDRRAA